MLDIRVALEKFRLLIVFLSLSLNTSCVGG